VPPNQIAFVSFRFNRLKLDISIAFHGILPVDRLETWTIFAAVAEQRSFTNAARQLARSPAAVTRAIAELEKRLATRLLNRTTRSVSLTDDGARYLEHCRRVLAEIAELDAVANGKRQEPRGSLTITAPVIFGRLHVLPIVEKFLIDHPAVDAKLLLLDRSVSLVEEGIDVSVRIGQLPDSSLRAIKAGEVRRGVYASPAYLRRSGVPKDPRELGNHACIAFTAVTPVADRWPFHRDKGAFAVTVKPRLVVNTGEAAIDAAVRGIGVTCVLSYQVMEHVAGGALRHLLADYEPAPLPIHVLHPAGGHVSSKVRLFIDAAVDDLRRKFAKG
jgi:DNA-binding transcriptional LysR family regulator